MGYRVQIVFPYNAHLTSSILVTIDSYFPFALLFNTIIFRLCPNIV